MTKEYQKDWDLSHWQHLYGEVKAQADFKREPEDFVVTETLSFEPTGEGEHLFLLIEKRQLNTQQVCEYLAKFFKKRLRDIGYAGLKDKQSVSRQWFSVQMNVLAQPDLSELSCEGIQLMRSVRHNRKLKIGALSLNHFAIRLRDVTEIEWLQARLAQLENGVPNYFGEQRFGFKGNNLNWADRMADGEEIKNKKIKGFALSASRAFLFNQVISQRIASNIFDRPRHGDVFLLTGSNSFFAEPVSAEIEKRLMDGDIQLSAPLVGEGDLATDGKIKALEAEVLAPYAHWQKMLAQHGLKQERRAILLVPNNLTWQVQSQDLIVNFELPTGCFATSVLRECVQFREQEKQDENSNK